MKSAAHLKDQHREDQQLTSRTRIRSIKKLQKDSGLFRPTCGSQKLTAAPLFLLPNRLLTGEPPRNLGSETLWGIGSAPERRVGYHDSIVARRHPLRHSTEPAN
jgi:hypothetical protein